jgi:hypothetical protein
LSSPPLTPLTPLSLSDIGCPFSAPFGFFSLPLVVKEKTKPETAKGKNNESRRDPEQDE